MGKKNLGQGNGERKDNGVEKKMADKKKQEGKKLVGIDDGWEKRWQKNLRRQHEERELGKDNGERRW